MQGQSVLPWCSQIVEEAVVFLQAITESNQVVEQCLSEIVPTDLLVPRLECLSSQRSQSSAISTQFALSLSEGVKKQKPMAKAELR